MRTHKKKSTTNTFLLILFKVFTINITTLGRHGCKLQPDWLAEAYDREAVFLAGFYFLDLFHIK